MDLATLQTNLAYLNTRRQNLVGYTVGDNFWSFYPQGSAIYSSQVTLTKPLTRSATSGATVTHKLQLKIQFCKLTSSIFCNLKTTLKTLSFQITLTQNQFKTKLSLNSHSQYSHHQHQLRQKEGGHWAVRTSQNLSKQHQHQQGTDG